MPKMPDPKFKPILTVSEAGQLLGLGEAQAYRAVARGVIPSIRVSPRRIVCPTAAVLRLLQYEPLDNADLMMRTAAHAHRSAPAVTS